LEALSDKYHGICKLLD
jgi:hypothetical protein